MLDFFRQFPEVLAVMSEKRDGSMKMFLARPNENRENRKKFFAGQEIAPERTVSAELVHGTQIGIVTMQDVSHEGRPSVIGHGDAGWVIAGADGLVTREKDIFLSVTVADCLPVFFYDPAARVIGIAHAGWRGLLGGVIGKTLETMSGCGAQAENIHAAFGPSIRQCHFEIQPDVLLRFTEYEKYVTKKDGKISVDLQRIAAEQLQDAGVQEGNIEMNTSCTFCERGRFFSYRRDEPEKIEAMATVIGIR